MWGPVVVTTWNEDISCPLGSLQLLFSAQIVEVFRCFYNINSVPALESGVLMIPSVNSQLLDCEHD